MIARGNQSNTSGLEGDSNPTAPQEPELQEGMDYYVENGLLVFTAAFLLKRGYCCDGGCRHCPYQEHEGHDR